MRNLKRALSLTLASVMLLGMMVVGSSAASYPDVEDTHNVEAIDVLQTIKVMVGDDNGNFGPDDQVNRAQMAVVMALLLDLDYDYYKGTNPFWDVPSWAEPYVAACYANGIVSGYNATTYGAGDPVTAVQAASMMMRALGYFKYQSDYRDGFELSTVRQASKISLFKDVNASSNNAALTRNQVAQLALNTLESTIVDAKDNTLSINTGANAGNISITGGQVDYIVRTSTEPFAYAFADNVERGDTTTTGNTGYTVQLGEQLFNGDLRKTRNTDSFGRPSNQWTYKFSEIGKYADTPDYTYTTSISGSTPADKVRNMGLKDYKWRTYSNDADGNPTIVSDAAYVENGKHVPVTGLRDAAALEKLAKDVAADGVLIEVFMDDNRTDTIKQVVVTRTQLMQVNVVGSSEVSLKVLSDNRAENTDNGGKVQMGTKNTFITVKNVKEDEDGYEVLKNLKADDYVLIVPVTTNDDDIYTVSKAIVPETLNGTLETIYTKSSNKKVAGIGVNGERYNMSYAWTADGDELKTTTQLARAKDCTVYLDTYGYAIYVKDVVANNSAIIIDYIYSALEDGKIVKYAQGWDASGNELTLNLGTSPANVSNTEATMQGKVYEYKVATTNNADYELIDPVKGSSMDGNRIVYAPAASSVKYGSYYPTVAPVNTIPYDSAVKFIFITSEGNKVGTDVTGITVKTGVSEVNSAANLTYILNKDCNKVIAVVVPNDDDAGNTTNLLYLEKITRYGNNASGKRVAFGTIWINGEKTDNVELNKAWDQGDIDKFYTYAESNGVYTLSLYNKTDKTTSVKSAQVLTKQELVKRDGETNGIVDYVFIGWNGQKLNARDAVVRDLYSDDNLEIISVKGMKDALKNDEINNVTHAPVDNFKVSYVYNGDVNSVNYNTVQYVYITKTDADGYTAPVDPGTPGQPDDPTGETFTMTAPTGVVYSVDKGANWNSVVSISGAVDEEIWMKPTTEGYFFKTAPIANDGSELETAVGGDGSGNDTAATPVSGQTGVYKFTITAADTITDVVKKSEVTAVVVRLTDSYVVESGSTSSLYLRYEDANGNRVTDVAATNGDNAYGDILEAKGYTGVGYASNKWTFQKGYTTLEIPDANVKTNCIRYYVGTRTAANLKLANVASSPDTLNLGTGVAVMYDKDGKIVGNQANAGSITAAANMDNILFVVKAKDAQNVQPGNVKKPTAEEDETIKVESTNNTDKTGFLDQNTEAYTGGDYDYSKATGKLTNAVLEIAAANNDARIRITQTNNALKIVNNTNTRVTTLETADITTEDPDNNNHVIRYEYLLMENGGNVTIKIERWKNGTATTAAADETYTITIENGVTFK